MCLNTIKRALLRRKLKHIVVDPKGVCLAIYCAKIYSNCLLDSDINYYYEKDLKDLYKKLHPENPYYDYDERQETAYNFLCTAVNCSNGDYVRSRIVEEFDNDIGI